MSDWVGRAQAVQVGDKVGYSKAFLQSTGQYTGDAPLARGTVIALVALSEETVLAEINWNLPELPSRVNVKNLSTVKRIAVGD